MGHVVSHIEKSFVPHGSRRLHDLIDSIPRAVDRLSLGFRTEAQEGNSLHVARNGLSGQVENRRWEIDEADEPVQSAAGSCGSKVLVLFRKANHEGDAHS